MLFLILPFMVWTQNLTTLRVDDLDDAQIENLVQRGKAMGYTEDQAESMAKSLGLSSEEATKFRERVLNYSKSPSEIQKKATPRNKQIGATRSPKDTSIVAARDSNAVFGMDFFKRSDFKMYTSGNENIQAPSNYILGSGDEVSVTVFGQALTNKTLKVDERGFIEFANLWKLNVSGLTYGQAEEAIVKRLSSNFSLQSNQIHTALSFARSISVNLSGEVLRPGTYTMPASNSAFNFVAAAGGPTEFGSMRRIKVLRGGKTVQHLDLYTYLTNPGEATLVFLQDGDHIVIEPVGPRSKVSGAVQRPMRYELLPGETAMQLLNYAGGFTEQASTVSVQVRRPVLGQIQLIDIPFHAFAVTQLQPADQMLVRGLNENLTDYVEVFGAVRYPGSYAWHKGLTSAELVGLAGGFTDKARRNAGYIMREQADYKRQKMEFAFSNAGPLENRDQLYVVESPNLGKGLEITVSGAVDRPIKIDYADGLTLGDVLRLAGGVRLDADLTKVEVSRVDTDAVRKRRAEIFTLSVPEEFLVNSELKGGSLDFQLKPYDQVVLRQKPNYGLQKLVYVGGEVKYPGYYALSSYNERVNLIMSRAGGPTDFADVDNARLFRYGAKNVVVELGSALQKPKSKFNYALRQGDSIVVPSYNNLIQIVGNGHRSSQYTGHDTLNAPFVGKMKADMYIKEYALGFAAQADRSSVYVIYPNGKFSRTRNFGLLKLYPQVKTGAQISVILKPEKPKTKKEVKFDVNQMIATLTTSLTGFTTLYLLITR